MANITVEITDEAGNVDLCEVEPAPSTRVIRTIKRIHSVEEHEARERYGTDPGTVYDQRFGCDADNGVDW